MAERELAILVTARDLATRTLKNVNRELDKTGSKIGKIGARGIGTSIKNIAKLGVAAAGVSLVLGVGAVNAAADFESQLNTINTVAQATPAQLEKIGAGIRKIARDTGAPLGELTQGFYDLVSAGIDAAQAQRVLEASNRLAIGGLGTAAEGVDLITTALNSYGVAVKDQGAESERFADIFAKSIETGKVTAAELAASFATIGPIAANAGIEIEELAAGYATLTAQGVPAAEASTQMRSALVALIRPSTELEKIQKKTGVNFAKLAKEKGLVVALERLRVEAEKAGVPLIDIMGRVEGFNFAVTTTGDNLENYNEDLADMGKATGTAARQMSERQQGLNFQIARLKALARDAGITIGQKLLPKLTPLAERAVAFLETHQPDIERFGDEIASAFDRAAEFAARIPWGAVGEGLRTAAEWSGRLLELFVNMPPEAQAAIVALAGLNKLSGGAISGIVGELGKGLIKGVLGMNAGVVNVRGAVVNTVGGGAGTGGGPGVPTAGAGGLLAGIGAEVAAAGGWAAVGAAMAVGFVPVAAAGIALAITGPASPEEQARNEALRGAAPAGRGAGPSSTRGPTNRNPISPLISVARDQLDASRRTMDQLTASRQAALLQQKATLDRHRAAEHQAAVLSSDLRKIEASQDRTAAAIRSINLPDVTVNVSTTVSVRDQVSRTRQVVKYGIPHGAENL